FAALVGLLRVVEAWQRRRAAAVAWQITLTDAIHRELGAVAAPTASHPLGGPWRVRLTLPLERPALVARVLEITQRALAAGGRAARDGVEVVVVPRPDDAGGRGPCELRLALADPAPVGVRADAEVLAAHLAHPPGALGDGGRDGGIRPRGLLDHLARIVHDAPAPVGKRRGGERDHLHAGPPLVFPSTKKTWPPAKDARASV
ncbi:MAG TPA: hypothetical protein VFX28_06620, partial [Methylomirabilota bacterium]|nr:hypothetical protein [Methylomirabilota bacterium]